MVFYFYENAMKEVDKVSVDGLVPNSTHLSHWKGNKTPEPFKADTATEIVFRYLSNPRRREIFPQIRIITNNHFDTDGLLSVWTLLNAKKAETMTGRLISAAEASDFSTFSSEEGVQINLLIKALCQHEKSPFAKAIKDYDGPREAAYYKALLPHVPDLFRKTNDYRSFWEPAYEEILESMALFEKGVIGLEEYKTECLSVIIDEKRPCAQAIDHYCQGNLFLVIEDRKNKDGGYGYELEYRYYAWADTVTRPPIKSIPMQTLCNTLNNQEGTGSGKWLAEAFPGRSLSSALKFTDKEGGTQLSRLHPETVTEIILSHLKQDQGESETESA